MANEYNHPPEGNLPMLEGVAIDTKEGLPKGYDKLPKPEKVNFLEERVLNPVFQEKLNKEISGVK